MQDTHITFFLCGAAIGGAIGFMIACLMVSHRIREERESAYQAAEEMMRADALKIGSDSARKGPKQ